MGSPGAIESSIEARFDDKFAAAKLGELTKIQRSPNEVTPLRLECAACKERIASFGGEAAGKYVCSFCFLILTGGNADLVTLLQQIKADYIREKTKRRNHLAEANLYRSKQLRYQKTKKQGQEAVQEDSNEPRVPETPIEVGTDASKAHEP